MSRIGLWWRAVRPFSFTVSVIPPILGALIASSENPGLKLNWLYFSLALIGCVIAHAGANLFSDYFDFKIEVDREGTFGGSGLLVEDLLKPRDIFFASLFSFFIASCIGVYFILTIPNGLTLLLIILVGGVLAFFYTAKPFALKYHALGDFAVFIAFGPAMTLGAYFVQAYRFSWSPVLYALPIAFLVDAILHSNNLRDIQNDKVIRIKTVAILLSENRAMIMYYGLVASAYVSTLILIVLKRMPWPALLTLLSVPLAVKLMNRVRHRNLLATGQFIIIDAATAQLHLVFGGLLLLSLIGHRFFIALS
jgi:1,4-dihydroxy-2-naphthoate octaprenyltransferase